MALFNINELQKIARKTFHLDERYFAADSAEIDPILQTYSIFDYSKEYDIFLSHSYKDRLAVAGLAKHLEQQYGYDVYVDWIEDSSLNRSQVSRATAKVIKNRMRQCRSLFYVTSANASSSKWMPWELGLMDGMKEKVAICPLTKELNSTDYYQGQEYLGLYPYITETKASSTVLWVNNDQQHYITFEQWINGVSI